MPHFPMSPSAQCLGRHRRATPRRWLIGPGLGSALCLLALVILAARGVTAS
jgi:hypothetical protein